MGAIPFLDADLFEQFVQQCNTSIQQYAYQQVLHDTTVAIDTIIHSQLLVLFAIRAKAHSLQCQYQAACDDAQKIIRFAPELAVGYLEQGRIYSMYGYQKRAIEAYDQALQNVKTGGGGVLEQLEAEKAEAATIQSRRVDFMSRLPSDCTYDIISLLPINAIMTCLFVSDTWRQLILECRMRTWKHFTADNNNKQLTIAAHHFAFQTEHLTIDLSDSQYFAVYLQLLTDGHFKKLHYLKTTPNASMAMRENASLLPRAFHGAGHVLTCLDLDMGCNLNAVTLAEILSVCKSVVSMSYATYAPRSIFRKHKFGDFSKLDNDHSLASLVLKSQNIEGDDIKDVLQLCQKIRRLVLNGCVPSVLDTINVHAPKLQILGYNPGRSTRKLRDIANNINEEQPGLRVLQMDNTNMTMRASASSILPVLYNHSATLKYLALNVASVSPEDITKLRTAYLDLEFSNLTTVTTWLLSYAQDFILELLQHAPKIETLTAMNIHDVKGLTRTIHHFPSLVQLHLGHIRTETADQDLYDLFQLLGKRSMSGEQPSLEYIGLFNISAIDNIVLYKLAHIKTLCRFDLRCKGSITTEGIQYLITLLGDQLRHAKLADMDTVTDDVLDEFCDSKNLEWVFLENLNQVSAKGINHLLANTKSAKFTKVRAKNCSRIGAVDRHYTKKRR